MSPLTRDLGRRQSVEAPKGQPLTMVSHSNRDGGGERLQRAARSAVPSGWLVSFSGRDEAKRLAELQADNDLLYRMMWAGYEGEEWEELSGRLIGYGYAVMVAWLRKGVIFERCGQRGCLLKATMKSRDPDEARSLAGETVTVAVIKFKETVLIPQVWRPDGGASLETFFVGQCLIRFANVYRRWRRENGCGGADVLDDPSRRSDTLIDLAPIARTDLPYGDPEAGVALESYLGVTADPITRSILSYVADGYRHEEIAQLLDLSVGAVKSRLYHLRQVQQTQRKGGNDAA